MNEHFEENVLYYGLEWAGFRQYGIRGTNKDMKVERFISFFGVCHLTCATIFLALKKHREERGDDSSLLYFLLTMSWFKTYATESVLAGMFSLTENTVRKWIWEYAKSLQWLKPSKVRTRRTALICCFHIFLSNHSHFI